MIANIAALAAVVGICYLLGPEGTMAVGIALCYIAVPLAIVGTRFG
jgi:hypothetical protein